MVIGAVLLINKHECLRAILGYKQMPGRAQKPTRLYTCNPIVSGGVLSTERRPHVYNIKPAHTHMTVYRPSDFGRLGHLALCRRIERSSLNRGSRA